MKELCSTMNTLLETKYQNRLTLTDVFSEGEAIKLTCPKCNQIFSDLDYFLNNCYWVDSRPIFKFKADMGQPFSVNQATQLDNILF